MGSIPTRLTNFRNMSRINILNKVGLLTSEDRKQPLEHGCIHSTFKTNIDLSQGVEIIPYGSAKMTLEQYSQDIASFMVWWTHFVMEDLNGFSGFSNVKFSLKGEIV